MKSTKSASFGGCKIHEIRPPITTLSRNTKKLNVLIKFDEGLQLSLAIDECLRKLNKYKRNTLAGKRAAVCLVVDLHFNRLDILEGSV